MLKRLHKRLIRKQDGRYLLLYTPRAGQVPPLRNDLEPDRDKQRKP
jgi:hypothetical protein